MTKDQLLRLIDKAIIANRSGDREAAVSAIKQIKLFADDYPQWAAVCRMISPAWLMARHEDAFKHKLAEGLLFKAREKLV